MTLDFLKENIAHPNVQAFLHAIRLGEGTSDEEGYRRIVGGQLFDAPPWAHPREFVYIPRIKDYSSAAGAYQFLFRTWFALERQYGFEDFSPENQDLGALALIAEKGALEDVKEGRIEDAVTKCAKVWASLPGAGYNQREEKMETVLAEYERWGGVLA